MSALFYLVAISVALALWGALLVTLFDRLLAVLERACLRAVIFATLCALPVGGAAYVLRSAFAYELAAVLPNYLIGTPFFTWLVPTLVTWAAVYYLTIRRLSQEDLSQDQESASSPAALPPR